MHLRNWPKGWRLALYWGGALIALCLILPGSILLSFFFGFGACFSSEPADLSVCSPGERLLLGFLLIAFGLLLYVSWVRFLQGYLNIDEKNPKRDLECSSLSSDLIPQTRRLALSQVLVVGRVEDGEDSGRTILLAENVLTFWSLYPFQERWIKKGDQLVVVYQQLPLSNSKFAMAFWNGPKNPVRGVAAITQSIGILVALVCVGIFNSTPVPFAHLLVTVSVLGGFVSVIYLILMLRAKASIRRFIAEARTPS